MNGGLCESRTFPHRCHDVVEHTTPIHRLGNRATRGRARMKSLAAIAQAEIPVQALEILSDPHLGVSVVLVLLVNECRLSADRSTDCDPNSHDCHDPDKAYILHFDSPIMVEPAEPAGCHIPPRPTQPSGPVRLGYSCAKACFTAARVSGV